MDQLRTTRRSASHGALHSAYSSHSKPPPPPFGPLRLPNGRLRSVKENGGFLASPGPLESMLKTTTETGDIGIFSIGRMSTAHTFHQLPRSRSEMSETRGPRRSESRASERRSFRDDRRRLPSYRDTTSEILSMYGSESQKSICSSTTRHVVDMGFRSNSMTSCGSRRALMHKPNGAIHIHSGDALQRPRSPFPYPTRLKRPGIRPSSPALTENGSVDYSRMVGIDRVSYRTVHGSYKSLYRHPGRRVPPLSLRPDINQPIRPPTTHGTYPLRRAPGHLSPYGSAESLSYSYRGRAGSGSSSQTLRTSSLTSIIDRYRHSPLSHQLAPRPLLHAGSFYYDYTEDFAYAAEQAAPMTPLAPVPNRGLNTHRPIVLKEGYGSHLELGIEEKHSTPTPESRQQTQGHLPSRLDSQGAATTSEVHTKSTDSIEQNIPAVQRGHRIEASTRGCDLPDDFLSASRNRYLSFDGNQYDGDESSDIGNDAILFSEQLSAASKSPERQVEIQSPGEATIRSVQATILETEEQQSVRTRSLSTVVDNDDCVAMRQCPGNTCNEGTPKHSYCQIDPTTSQQVVQSADHVHFEPSICDKRIYSLDPALSDLASLVKSFERASKSPFPGDVSILDITAEPLKNHIQHDDKLNPNRISGDSSTEAFDSESLSSDAEEDGDMVECGSLLRRNRRNHAILRAYSHGKSMRDLAIPDIAIARSETPMLAPKPISPAKELRVKNSIPQLMKALPPLPADIDHCGSLILDGLQHQFELSTICSPADPSTLTIPRSTPKDEPVAIDIKDHPEKGLGVVQHQHKSPRFKVRLANSTAGSNATAESRPWNKDKNYPWIPEISDINLASLNRKPLTGKSGKPRLKLKMSRNALQAESDEDNGTIKRCLAAERSTGLSEIALRSPRDLFTSPDAMSRMFPTPPSPFSTSAGTRTPEIQSIKSGCNSHSMPMGPHTPAPSTPRRGSLDAHVETRALPHISSEHTPSDRGTFGSDRGNSRKRRDLKKKFSNLKRRPVGSFERGERIALAVPVTSTQASLTASPETVGRKPKPGHQAFRVIHRRRLRQTLSRWAKGAKRVVDACVGKRRGTNFTQPEG